MLVKFVGPYGPFINEKLKKSIAVGEVFDCPNDVLAHCQMVAPNAFKEPTELEVELYKKASKKADSEELDAPEKTETKKPGGKSKE